MKSKFLIVMIILIFTAAYVIGIVLSYQGNPLEWPFWSWIGFGIFCFVFFRALYFVYLDFK